MRWGVWPYDDMYVQQWRSGHRPQAVLADVVTTCSGARADTLAEQPRAAHHSSMLLRSLGFCVQTTVLSACCPLWLLV